MLCGKRHKTVKCPSDVRPSVCPVDRQQQRRAAGLLLRALQTEDRRAAIAVCEKKIIVSFIITFGTLSRVLPSV